MLLNLQKQGSAHILEVTGDVDAKGASILRAGITKLMKSGKDRIVIDFSKAGAIDGSAIQELGELAKLANELMGKIVAAGAGLKAAKEIGATIPLLPSIKEAIDYLNQAKPPIEEISPELDALIREKDAKIQALENQVALSSPEELRKLRAENESLRQGGQDLEERLKRLLAERRLPPDADSMLEHVTSLERNLTKLTAQIEASGNAKK